MNIAVFIKQVPDTDDVQWTADNNIDRANTESVFNPADLEAASAALRLKKQYGGRITAVSMGPKKALEILKDAIARGFDDACLLYDSKFTGSDTCATSKVLASAASKLFSDADLLLFGQSAQDGETSQTGPETAVRLNMPFINHVSEITEIKDGYAFVTAETETEKISYKVKLPAVLCIHNYAQKPPAADISGFIRAHGYDYKIYGISDLGLNECETGVKGSPTYVSKVYKTQEGRNCRMIDTDEFLKIIKEASKNA